METRTKLILTVMHVIFWIVFIGLCIKTGAVIISFLVSLFVNPEGAKNLYMGLNLQALQEQSVRQYVSVMSFVIFISGMKTYLAYLVVKIFSRFDYVHPFNSTNAVLISEISHIALGTGIVAVIANGYCDWLVKRGASIPLHWESSEFLFLAGIIFIIAQVFKRGVELQTENELTV